MRLEDALKIVSQASSYDLSNSQLSRDNLIKAASVLAAHVRINEGDK